ncbi:MAG: hypothetical protein ABR508_12280 [Candidatus Baltobacteraceae bacterium]
MTRVVALVLDSGGVGALPDAAACDGGANTLGNAACRLRTESVTRTTA